MKKMKRKIGDILKIDLGDKTHAYAHVSTSPLVIFYDFKSEETLPIEKIILLPIAFKIWVYNDIITSGRWPKIGSSVLNEELLKEPYAYKQDIITGALAIYHPDFADTNYERPATLSEVQGLERAAVWDWGDVEERLQSHFAGTEGDWVKDMAIDETKVPCSQRK